MIENKTVKIYKDNDFDKGWALFDTYSDFTVKNFNYEAPSVSDIVNKITYATEIFLVLFDNCLPRAIVDELIWVNKYVAFTVIARSEQVLEKYGALNFAKVTTDDKVSVNYFAVYGDGGKSYYLFTDEITETDDTVERVLLGHERPEKYRWIDGAHEVYVFEENGRLEHKELLDLCAEKEIKAFYVCNAIHYNKSIYDALSDTPIKILVAGTVKNAVIFIKDNRLYCVYDLFGSEIIAETESIDHYFGGNLFENMKLKENLTGNEIPEKTYFIDNDKMMRISFDDSIVVQINVTNLSMKDFIEEKFDRSVTDKHNDYCFRAKRVEYRFTLVPPIFDDSYSYSDIYGPITDAYRKWEKNFTVDPHVLWEEVKEFGHFQRWGDFIDLLKQTNEYLSETVMHYEYSGYHAAISKYIGMLKAENDTLSDKFLQIYDNVSGESSTAQYSKFDEEIEGYRRTIKEKQILVGLGRDVISNNRRIEILEKKIKDLSALKERFKSKSSDRESVARSKFINECMGVMRWEVDKTEVDSVFDVINKGGPTKIAKLKLFVGEWMRKISVMLQNGITILEEFAAIDIPEDYVVYDKNGKRYIIIDEEEEYYKTLSLCEKYKAECLTRR